MDNRTYKQVCCDLAYQVGNLGWGPDDPAFVREYADAFNCLELAFHDSATAFVEELTAAKADELHTALADFETAIISGNIEARDLAARTVAGLVRAHALKVGDELLTKHQSHAWEYATDAAIEAHHSRMGERA